MKNIIAFFRGAKLHAAVIAGGLALLTGCTTPATKSPEKPPQERGWIGGEYKLAKRKVNLFIPEDATGAFPKALPGENNAGLVITALSSNTPARLAGLREGDLILEIEHQPIVNLHAFFETVDHLKPGAALALKAWRSGQTADYTVTVGRETYRHNGVFAVSLPPIVRGLDLWPDPGFSLAVLGYDPRPGKRVELGSVKGNYTRACGQKYEPQERDWSTWLVIMELSRSKTILSQEPAASN